MRVQHVAVGATHPEKAKALYATALPGAKQMLLEDMHTAPPTLKQEFVTCNGPDAKVAAMRDPTPTPSHNRNPNRNHNPNLNPHPHPNPNPHPNPHPHPRPHPHPHPSP